MTTFLLGLIIFLGIHSLRIVAPGVRDAAIGKLGAGPWKGLYTGIATAGLVMIIMGWPEARMNGITVWTPPAAMRHITMLLMLPVFPLLLATYLPGRIQSAVKHPMLTATKLWALAHLLPNGQLHEILLFGGFLAWAVLDRISLKRRPDAITPAPSGWTAKDGIAIVLGVALYGLFVAVAHGWLIGVPLMPARA